MKGIEMKRTNLSKCGRLYFYINCKTKDKKNCT